MDTEISDDREGLATQPPPQAQRKDWAPEDSVPRHMGWIEPWVGMSVGFFTAWMAVTAYIDRPLLWLYAGVGCGLAWWSWRRPARRQQELLLRASCFALVGFIVLFQGHMDPLGVGGHFFYWIVVPMVLYAFLLKSGYAWVLLAVNLAVFVVSVAVAGNEIDLRALLMRVGFLVVFAVAAIRMGAVLRRTDELLEARRMDLASGLLNEYGFIDHGTDLWRYCRKAGLAATLVFLDIPDLRRLRELYGANVARDAATRVVEAIGALDVGKNVLGRLSVSRFALLVPSPRDAALAMVGEKLGTPPKIEIDDDALEMLFLLEVHAVESRLQGIAFARFFATEVEALEALAERRAVRVNLPPAAAASAASAAAAPMAPLLRSDDEAAASLDVQLPITVPLEQYSS